MNLADVISITITSTYYRSKLLSYGSISEGGFGWDYGLYQGTFNLGVLLKFLGDISSSNFRSMKRDIMEYLYYDK